MNRTAVTGIINHNGQIIIGKKIRKDGHFLSGKWHIPGGHVEKNEHEEEALVREMQEETGLSVKVIKFIDSHSRNGILVKWYLCKPFTFDLNPGDDLEEVKFVPKKDVSKLCDQVAVSLWPPKVVEYFKS